MFNWFKKFKSPFPKTVKGYWYTGRWYMYRADLRSEGKEHRSDHTEWPIEDKIMFNPFKVGLCGRDASGLIDGLIPAIRKDNMIGLYKIVSEYRMPGGSDLAMWDNGMEVNLKFVKSIEVK